MKLMTALGNADIQKRHSRRRVPLSRTRPDGFDDLLFGRSRLLEPVCEIKLKVALARLARFSFGWAPLVAALATDASDCLLERAARRSKSNHGGRARSCTRVENRAQRSTGRARRASEQLGEVRYRSVVGFQVTDFRCSKNYQKALEQKGFLDGGQGVNRTLDTKIFSHRLD